MSDLSSPERVARGIVAGLIAGAVAAFAMDRFQAVAAPLLPADGGGEGDPATVKAADAIGRHIVGVSVRDAAKPLAGQAVHYTLGVGLGVAYGIAAEFRPAVTVGWGAGFGIAAATLLDEAAVPAVGLGSPPWAASLPTTLYGYASHLVFGGVAEIVRRQVAGTLAA